MYWSYILHQPKCHVSIFDKYHHNIIYSKINMPAPLPPIYIREVWDYKKANIENIKKALENLSIDEKVELLNKA